MDVLPRGWAVPELFRRRLGEQAGRQRVMAADGQLLLVLHALPHRTPSLFWRQADGRWQSTQHGARPQGLRLHVQEFAAAVAELEERLEAANDSEACFEVLRAATPLVRTARNLHGVLQQAREAAPADRELIACRDLAYEAQRGAELVYDEARNLLSYTIAHRAEAQAALGAQQARSGARLNQLAAFFFPLSALAALFGMNLSNPLAIGAVLASGLVLGSGVAWAVNLKASASASSARRSTSGWRRRARRSTGTGRSC